MSDQEDKKIIKKKIQKETPAQKNEREKATLEDRLKNNNLNDINSRVAFILNHFPNARNNDIDLTIQYWKVFHHDVLGNLDCVTYDQLYKLTRSSSLIRARAKVQNTYGLFLASKKVREKRSKLDEEHRQKEIEDQPSAPLTSVFCDESGKNEKYLIIGSLWINEPYRVFKIYQALTEWKKDNDIGYEFHFSELKKQRVDKAIQFLQTALSESDVLGFKAVIVNSEGLSGSDTDESIFKLHYQLVVQGLEHEKNTQRIDFPRQLTLTKDKDAGADKIRLAEFRQKLKVECQSYFKNQVTIGDVESEDSSSSVYLQLADLFTGSISRKLNKKDNLVNHKDEFADKALSMLGIGSDLVVKTEMQDFVEIIHLT